VNFLKKVNKSPSTPLILPFSPEGRRMKSLLIPPPKSASDMPLLKGENTLPPLKKEGGGGFRNPP